MQKVAEPVLDVLRRVTFTGECAVLPPNLDPKLYKQVNKVIEAQGGEWKRGKKAHVFAGKDARTALLPVMHGGEYLDVQKDQHYFPTPQTLVCDLVMLARVEHGARFLEPSAGRGEIVKRLVEAGALVHAIEINPDYEADLGHAGAALVTIQDFLTVDPKPVYDGIVMNPPFGLGGQSDIRHVQHAWRFLKPGGILVSVTSPSWTFRTNHTSREFSALVAAHGHYDENDAVFDGTNVKTVTVVLTK